MNRLLSILLVTSSLLGCAKVDEGSPTDWKSLALPGKTLTLIDRKKVEVFPFAEGGTTAAVIGIKDEALAAPIFFWKIRGNTLLISEGPSSGVYEELSSPVVNGSVVTATRKSGSKSQYQLAKSGS